MCDTLGSQATLMPLLFNVLYHNRCVNKVSFSLFYRGLFILSKKAVHFKMRLGGEQKSSYKSGAASLAKSGTFEWDFPMAFNILLKEFQVRVDPGN